MSRINQISNLGNWMMSIYSHEKEALKKNTSVGATWRKLKVWHRWRFWGSGITVCCTESNSRDGWPSGDRSERETEICESEAESHTNGEIAQEEGSEKKKIEQNKAARGTRENRQRSRRKKSSSVLTPNTGKGVLPNRGGDDSVKQRLRN